jgi:hypothetical protein
MPTPDLSSILSGVYGNLPQTAQRTPTLNLPTTSNPQAGGALDAFKNMLNSRQAAYDQFQATRTHKPGGPGRRHGLLGRIGSTVGGPIGNVAKDAPRLLTEGVPAIGQGGGDWLKHYLGTYEGRKQLLIIGAIAAGGVAAGGGFGGGAAGAGTGASAGAAGIPTGWAGSTGALGAGGGLAAGAGAAGIGAAGAAGGGAGVAGGGGFLSSFGGQTLLNTGANLLSGYMQNRAQSKAQKASQKQIEARIRQALAALSPEHIMALAQQFLPQMAANMSGAGQTAIQAVREQAARTGQLENPRALSFEAGTRAKLAGDVQQRAFEAAFNTAGNQASQIGGAPYTNIQPQTGIADAIMQSINQAYYTKARTQQPNQNVPYRFPYTPGVPYGYGGQL